MPNGDAGAILAVVRVHPHIEHAFMLLPVERQAGPCAESRHDIQTETVARAVVAAHPWHGKRVLDLTRFRGRPTRPSFGAEVAHGIEQEGGAA